MSLSTNNYQPILLSKLIGRIEVGVSVLCDNRGKSNGEYGVLKTSSVGSGIFDPRENKAALQEEYPRLAVNPKQDSIIICRSNTPELVGSSAYVDKTYEDLFLPDTLWQTADHNSELVSVRWLAYLFNTSGFKQQIKTIASGTSANMKKISQQNFAKLEIPVPPLDEQRKIAEILSTWDAAIGLTEQLIAALGRRKQALMQLLLTGAVRFAEFIHSDEQQETEFGSIPADWTYARIGEIAEAISERNVEGDELPVLSCTKYDGLVDSLTYFGRQIFSDDISTYKIVRRGQFAYATNHIEEGSIGYQNLYDAAVISPMYSVFETTEQVHDAYLYSVLKTELYRKIFEVNTSASVDRRGSLRWPQFSRIRVPLPELDEQQAISATLETAQEIIESYRQLLSELQTQKRGLMQQLLTGQVKVRGNLA